MFDLSTEYRTQNFEQSLPESLIFGAIFSNKKFFPKRVEFWNILQKVQVVEKVEIHPFL
jgi:hypothetical protein